MELAQAASGPAWCGLPVLRSHFHRPIPIKAGLDAPLPSVPGLLQPVTATQTHLQALLSAQQQLSAIDMACKLLSVTVLAMLVATAFAQVSVVTGLYSSCPWAKQHRGGGLQQLHDTMHDVRHSQAPNQASLCAS